MEVKDKKIFFFKKKNYGPFLQMGFNKTTEALQGDSLLVTTMFPQIPGMYSFDQPWKEERLSQPWVHLVVLNMGPLG